MGSPAPEAQVAGYRADIDGLRAIAIGVVLVFHAFPKVLPGGFVGVDIFFVISGFLISTIILKALSQRTFRFADFYARRTRRIFPALIAVLLFVIAAGWIALMPTEYAQLGKHVAGGSLFAQNAVLYGEAGYFDTASELKPLMHLWSLAVEEQFYLLYPLLLWVTVRARLSVLKTMLAVAALSFGLAVWRLGEHPVEVFFLAHTRWWELMVGGILAQLRLAHGPALDRALPPGGWRTQLTAVAGLGLALGSAWALDRTQPFPGARALLPTMGAAFLIAAGPGAWVNRKLLSARPMVSLGLVSYPLYLWHWPLLSFAAMTGPDRPAWLRGALVLLSVGLAWATRAFVERPFRFSPKTARGRVPVLVGAMAATAVAGVAVFAADGLPTRFPETIREFANFKPDYKTDARYPQCWLSNAHPANGFAPTCRGAPAGGPGSVWLWGDSHAARLYAGLSQVLGDAHAVTQFTRDACGPIVGWGYPRCAESNEYVLSQAALLHPETVLLFANWHDLAWHWRPGQPHATGLVLVLRGLRQAGVRRIVVLGQAPFWVQALPRLVHDAWQADFPLHRVPERLAGKQVPGLDEQDADLEALVEAEGATFVDVRKFLCDEDGCLVRTSSDAASLTTYDYGHLTTPGAVHLSKLLVPLLGLRSAAR